MSKTCNTCSHSDCDNYKKQEIPEWKQAIMRRFMKVD